VKASLQTSLKHVDDMVITAGKQATTRLKSAGAAIKDTSKEVQIQLLKRGVEAGKLADTTITAGKNILDITEYLINQSIEIDTSEPDRNPLFAAIYGSHFKIVQLLVENNIDISIKYSGNSMKDMDAYAFAIERGQMEIAEYLKRKMDENEQKEII
jgi:uncharacterized protein